MRSTKIVATLGPATDQGDVLERMIEAGVDVVRLNFSHGSPEDQRRRVAAVRAASKKLTVDVGILVDLQGPKIRIESFCHGEVELSEGGPFTLDCSLGPKDGTAERVGVTYRNLCADVQAGDVLLLSDGAIALRVEEVEGPRVHCRVEAGGALSDHKGLNRRGGGLTAEPLTAKDRQDIRLAGELDVDYLAVSFPRHASDVERARRLFREAGGQGALVAKIERSEAVENLESIIIASDAVMIARGDLAVEIGDAPLPGVQKRIIREARERNTVVITATQMMESMVTSSVPTRAEILDVANAVLDGTDAVMLSEETAVGRHPVRVVEAMARVCRGAEAEPVARQIDHSDDIRFSRVDETIALAAMYVARHLDVKALVALTETGTTPLYMSRVRSGIPIYALTSHERTRRRVTLYSDVYPVAFGEGPDAAHLLRDVARTLHDRDAVEADDVILLTRGTLPGISGGTNSLHLVRIRDVLGGAG